MKHLAWLVLLVAACTDFTLVERDVCGNGLLERGEDCDSGDPTCVSCSLTCTDVAGCPSKNYTCGVDGLCHAAGGALAEPEPVGAFEVNDFRISDVDHDAIGDALGVSRSSIVVRYGGVSGALSQVESTLTPPQTGPAAFGDLDDDFSDDLSIMTLDGVVSYTSRYEHISSLEVVSTTVAPQGQAVEVLKLLSVGPLTIGSILSFNGNIAIQVLDFENMNTALGGLPCGRTIPASQFSIDNVDVYKVRRPGGLNTDTVISLIYGAAGAPQTVCVLAFHKGSGALTLTDVTPPTPLAVTRRPVLADMTDDSDPCPSLLIPTPGMAGAMTIRRWEGTVQSVGNYCGFTTPVNTIAWPPNVPNATNLVGRLPLFPKVILSLNAPDALVFATGVLFYLPGFNAYTESYRSTRSITEVAHGDFDGDGDIDGALIGPGDDIEILLRADPLTLGVPYFLGFLIDTASQPSNLTLDDFDGNGRTDVAYTEPVGSRLRLMIAYGTADQPLPPIEVGRFAAVQSIAPIKLPNSSDILGVTADMIVLFPGMPSKLTILSGSAQRTMLSFFDPRTDNGADDVSVHKTTIFRGAVIGKFTRTAGIDHPDVVLLAALRPGLPPTALTPVPRVGMRAWSVRGSDDGLDGTQTDGIEIKNVDDCATAGGSGLCVDEAKYLAWTVAADKDVVIAVDRAQAGAVFDPTNTSGGKLSATAFDLSPPPNSVIRSLHAADLDGDGVKELVATFLGTADADSAVLACQVDAAGMPNGCRDLMPDIKTVVPAAHACVDAAPGRFQPQDSKSAATKGTSLIVLCKEMGTAIVRVSFDETGTHASLLRRVPRALTSLQVGDVTGDGVDDLVAVEGEAGSRTAVVIQQCTNRDTKCIDAKEAP